MHAAHHETFRGSYDLGLHGCEECRADTGDEMDYECESLPRTLRQSAIDVFGQG